MRATWLFNRLYVQVWGCRLTRVQYEFIVDRDSQTLPAANIAFGGLDRDMSEEKLNLLELTSGIMAETRA